MKATWMTWWCDLTRVDDPLVLKHGNQYIKPLIDRWFSQLKPSIYRNCPIVFCVFSYFPYYFPLCSMIVLLFSIVFLCLPIFSNMAVCQNLETLVNIKIAGKWMFIPLKMVSIGIDPYPYIAHDFPKRFSDATAEDWEACDCAHCRGSILGSTLESSVSSGVFMIPSGYLTLLTDMAMDQYLLIPFLGGWTSIYQLYWCSPGVQGFDTLPYGKWPLIDYL